MYLCTQHVFLFLQHRQSLLCTLYEIAYRGLHLLRQRSLVLFDGQIVDQQENLNRVSRTQRQFDNAPFRSARLLISGEGPWCHSSAAPAPHTSGDIN